MEFLTLSQERYTTKKYDPSKKLSPEVLEALLESLRLSPSSINSQPWFFSIVEEESVKNELAKASFFNQPKVENASHLIVFGVYKEVQKFEQEIAARLPEGAFGYYERMVKPLGEQAIKTWISNQVYLSLGYFLSACASFNIDSTPMEGIDVKGYDAILKNPDFTTLFAVALGYRDSEDQNQPTHTPKSRKKKDEVFKFYA